MARIPDYTSYSDATTLAAPASSINRITVLSDGQWCEYVENAAGLALTTKDGRRWKPAPDLPALFEHYGVAPHALKNGALTDYTDHVKRAVQEVQGRLVFTGWIRVRFGILIPKTVQLEVRGGYRNGGFSVRYYTDGSAAEQKAMNGDPDNDYVISFGDGEPAADTIGFSMWFYHPSTSDRAILHRYPWALSLTDATRARLGCIRIEQCWNGLKAEATSTKNPGGVEIECLEIGAFNEWCKYTGAKDFLKFDKIHVWPFGYAGNLGHRAIAEATPPTGLFQNIDGLVADSIQIFIGTLRLESSETGRLPLQINSISLDGSHARLTLAQGATQIGKVYSTKGSDAPVDKRDIEVFNGRNHHIGQLLTTSFADAAVFVHSNARLSIGAWNARHLSTGRRAGIVRGALSELSIAQLYLEAHGGDNATRTAAMIRADEGGKLVIGSVTVRAEVSTSHALVEYLTDNQVNYIDARMLPGTYSISVPAGATLGTYLTRQRASVVEGGNLVRRDDAGPLVVTGGKEAGAGANIELYPTASGGNALIDANHTVFRRLDAGFTVMDINALAGRIWMSLPVFADNAAAVAGGLTAGQLYRTSAGAVRSCV